MQWNFNLFSETKLSLQQWNVIEEKWNTTKAARQLRSCELLVMHQCKWGKMQCQLQKTERERGDPRKGVTKDPRKWVDKSSQLAQKRWKLTELSREDLKELPLESGREGRASVEAEPLLPEPAPDRQRWYFIMASSPLYFVFYPRQKSYRSLVAFAESSELLSSL